MINFRYLNEEDMIKAGVKDMHSCISTCEEAYKLLGKGDYIMGGKLHNSHGISLTFPNNPEFEGMPKNAPDRRFFAMPAYLGGKFHLCGEKWYGSNIENPSKGLPRSILMLTLNDPDTGAPVAYMSANVLSAMRTGAVPGVAVKYLAKEDAKVASLIGPGVINRTTLMAIMDARPGIEVVKLKGRGMANLEKMANFIRENYPQVKDIIICDSMDEAIADSDIVSMGTSGKDPEVNSSFFKDGVLLLGSSRFKMDDDFLVNRCQAVVDNWGIYESNLLENGGVFPEGGFRGNSSTARRLLGNYFLDYVNEGLMERSDIWTMPDVIAAKVKRTSPTQSFACACFGMPVWDVAWGWQVLQNAEEKNIGTVLKLWDTPDMF